MDQIDTSAAQDQAILYDVDPVALVMVCAMLSLPLPLGLEAARATLSTLSEAQTDQAAQSLLACGGARCQRENSLEFDAALAVLLHQASQAKRVISLSVAQLGQTQERLWYCGREVQVLQLPTTQGQVQFVGVPEPAAALDRLTDGLGLAGLPAGEGQPVRLLREDLREAQIAALSAQACSDSLAEAGVPVLEADALGKALAANASQGMVFEYRRDDTDGSRYVPCGRLSWLADEHGVWMSQDGLAQQAMLTLVPISGDALLSLLLDLTQKLVLEDADGR